MRLRGPPLPLGAPEVWRKLGILTGVALISAYRVMIAPLLVGSCKFCPTCSEYALQAIREWGLWRGAWLTFKRVLRCHPFSGPGGIDPVPLRKTGPSSPAGRPDARSREEGGAVGDKPRSSRNPQSRT